MYGTGVEFIGAYRYQEKGVQTVFNKKKAELDDKKTELQAIAHKIHNQEKKKTSTPNMMPSFICVDGSGTGQSADNTE